jgi:hypothetical protein
MCFIILSHIQTGSSASRWQLQGYFGRLYDWVHYVFFTAYLWQLLFEG